MKTIRKSVFVILLIGLLSSCQNKQLKPVTLDRFKTLDRYEVDAIPFNYASDCKMVLKTATEKFSSSCEIAVSRNRKFRIVLNHTIGGSLLMFYLGP